MRRRALLGLLVLPTACALPPPIPGVQLPATSPLARGLTDPGRSAILSTSYALNNPATLAGNPAAAAQALANLEFLAVHVATDQYYRDFDPLVAPMLQQGRDETRAIMGFRPGAPAQVAVDALYGTSAALEAGDRTRAREVLTPLAPGQEEAVLARLAALPPLPRAALATARANAALRQKDLRGGRDDWVWRR